MTAKLPTPCGVFCLDDGWNTLHGPLQMERLDDQNAAQENQVHSGGLWSGPRLARQLDSGFSQIQLENIQAGPFLTGCMYDISGQGAASRV